MKIEEFDGKLWKVTYEGDLKQHKRMELIGDAPAKMANEVIPEPSDEVLEVNVDNEPHDENKEVKKKKRGS
jgi:hypothetical protein